MSANTHTTETTAERKPPTIADIVREKTGDGALIIDFFTDVMTGRIEGAELCHRIDVAKELVKYGSKDAAEFLAKYKGVPCGHSTRGRPNQADPCTAEERTLVEVTLNAPPTLTKDFLTVLSGIDEFLMARLIRAQTADGVTIIEFLDDVMQDRTDGFKTHHRIAAAKELIVHIVRDEQPSHTPSPSTRETDRRGSQTPSPLTGEGWGEGDSPVVGADPRVRPLPGSHTPSPSTGEGWGEGDSPVVGADPRVRPLPGSHTPSPSTGEGWGEGDPPPLPEGEGWGEGDSSVVPAKAEGNPDNSTVVPAKSLPRTRYGAGTQGRGVARPSKAGVHPEPNSSVVPAKSLPRTRYGAGTQGRGVARPSKAGVHPEPNSSVVPAPTAVVPAEAGTHPRDPEPGSQLETLPARPIEQHWHEPHPHGAPIDSTHPGRSPPS